MYVKIAIIGQGVSGTTTALYLLETYPGIRVTLYGDRPFEDTTSFGPAGHFQVNEEAHREWGKISFEKFAKLERDYGSLIGVKYTSGHYQTDEKTEIENLEKFNSDIVHNFHILTKREKNHLFTNQAKYCAHFSTYSTEGKIYVPWLKKQCELNGAIFMTREIHSFDELVDEGYDIIINCSGIHGSVLAGDDDTMYPIRGVAFEIDSPGFKHFSCHGWTTFILPLDHSVLAGTVRQKGRYDRNVTDEDRKEILNKIYKYHPSLKNHKILNEWCGLRPHRPIVRVEKQTKISKNGKSYDVIHNYGHGSNGFTLSWGTAHDVVKLIGNILNEKQNEQPKL